MYWVYFSSIGLDFSLDSWHLTPGGGRSKAPMTQQLNQIPPKMSMVPRTVYACVHDVISSGRTIAPNPSPEYAIPLAIPNLLLIK